MPIRVNSCQRELDFVERNPMHHPTCCPGRVPLQVSLNGQDFAEDKAYFSYLSQLQIGGMMPSAGVIYGGAMISIYGSGFSFSSLLACRFNNSVHVDATYIDAMSIRCVTPQVAQPTVMSVEVTMNGFDYAPVPGSFSFVDPPEVIEVRPAHRASWRARPSPSREWNVR